MKGPHFFEKRKKEMARQQKAKEKADRKAQRKAGKGGGEDGEEFLDADGLPIALEGAEGVEGAEGADADDQVDAQTGEATGGTEGGSSPGVASLPVTRPQGEGATKAEHAPAQGAFRGPPGG